MDLYEGRSSFALVGQMLQEAGGQERAIYCRMVGRPDDLKEEPLLSVTSMNLPVGARSACVICSLRRTRPFADM
jgi:hypothetical protein